METRRVSEELQSAPRLRVGLPSRGTSVSLVNRWARRLIFTHISPHARLEIPMNLRDPSAFSPPRPASPVPKNLPDQCMLQHFQKYNSLAIQSSLIE